MSRRNVERREMKYDFIKYRKVLSTFPTLEGVPKRGNKVSIGNSSGAPAGHNWDSLGNISRYIRGISLSRMEELKVLSINESGDVVFHFFGSGHDKNRVREAGVKLIERGHLGDITLLPSEPAFLLEPALHLNSVQISKKDRREGDVRIGDQVILSCVAQGTSYMEFTWFKDGDPINVSKSTGELWTKIMSKDTKDEYSAYLGIESVTPWDEGRYTCQVVDWGVQECRSIYLEVVQAPSVQILPMSASLQKGENIDLKCVSANELIRPDGEQIGYSWTRDAGLFRLNLGQEVWEDLKPGGSILRVHNIQKSTTYTCMAHTSASTQAKQSVRIEVVNHTTMAMCRGQTYLDVKWGITAPGSTSLAECPNGYYGMAKRQCLISEPGTAYWQRPDFSRCISDKFDTVISDFRILARGYLKTSVENCLATLLAWLETRTAGMYPGEGEPVIELTKDVLNYLNRTESWAELVKSSSNFYKSVDLLLLQPNSIINELRVRDLQVLLNRWSLLLADHHNGSSAHFAYSTFVVDIFNVFDDARFIYYIPTPNNHYPAWYSAKVKVHIVSQFPEVKNTSCIAVVNFRNISKFLPNRSTQKTIDGGEVIYEIQSNVISISVSSHLKVHVDLEVPLHVVREGWNVTCAVAPSLEATWDFSACNYAVKLPNSSQCVCQWPGVYSALLTKQSKASINGFGKQARPSSIVLIGCTCCLVQCLLAFVLLLLRWFHRKTCLLFLKLQCCASVAATMCIFIYCARFPPSPYGFPSLNILTEILVLLGLTSHLSKLLVIYTEVVRLPNVQNIKKTVFGITTGVTTLAVLSSLLAHKLIGGELKSWWLPFDSAIFFIFTACGILIVVLFIFLFGNLLHRLRFLLCIQDEKTTTTINRRIGLLKRTGFLFVSMICMTTSSILYINVPTKTNHYAFSIICAIFGFVIFLCYVLHSESSLNMKLLKQFKIYNSKDHDYSSESENNLFNFFTKQDAEVESDCAPPCLKSPGIGMTELTPVIEKPAVKPKMVTFNGEPVLNDSEENDEVDLEVYPNSPRKFSKGISFLSNDKNPQLEPMMQIDNIKFEMNPIPDVLTTRASVEADGVLTNFCAETVVTNSPPLVELRTPDGTPETEAKTIPAICISEAKSNSQTKNEALPTIEEAEDGEEKDVLDRITHDLDYLLNRTDEEPTAQGTFQRPKKHVTICEGSKTSQSSGYGKTVL
ncbi:hypothetical protein GE061_017660 [Apolygus lucorum]|uniref:Ig-like domain-containing protein n=1 Tax=Apolygus lucorum TaxID=248454 RepID=A0A8S9XBN2_APOLU|nr:hypothetical protein GE061_017660 [Apolygus lucorum]